MIRSSTKYLILLAVSGVIITLDQATKMYIHTRYALGESTSVVENFFNITYVRNKGAAFGFLSNLPDPYREGFFLAMTPVALFIILLLLRSVAKSDKIQILALSGIFGGAIGNYIDRIRFGYVIDFLDAHWFHKHAWPAFNVADSAIVGGVSILILLMFRKEEPKDKPDETIVI